MNNLPQIGRQIGHKTLQARRFVGEIAFFKIGDGVCHLPNDRLHLGFGLDCTSSVQAAQQSAKGFLGSWGHRGSPDLKPAAQRPSRSSESSNEIQAPRSRPVTVATKTAGVRQ